jgi:hypothetical protein
MTIQEAIKWQQVIKRGFARYMGYERTSCDMAIKALKMIESLKSGMKSMKNDADSFADPKYQIGYISAISTLEVYLAMLENGNH